jgi:LEA14-like dessication related protein
MSKRLKIILIVTVALLGAGFLFFRSMKKRLIRTVVPQVEEVYINNLIIENGVGRAHLILFLENKDVIDYNVKSMDLALNNSSLELMRYKRDSSYVLLAGEKKKFDLEFDIDTKQLMKRIRNLQNQDSTTVTITGDILFDTFFGDYKMNLNKTVKVKVPNPPDISIREVEYVGMRGLDSLDFNIHLAVLNYNPNILGIKDVKYRFSSEEYFESHGMLPNVKLDTSDTVVRIVPITVITKRKLELLSKIVLNTDRLEYEIVLDGILLLENENQQELNVSVTKRDTLEIVKKNKQKKVKFTNLKKKERQAKREQRRTDREN